QCRHSRLIAKEPRMTMAEATYWRIRMRTGDDDYSEEAWNRNEVGIWYGAWTASDFAKAEASGDGPKYLTALPKQKALRWKVTPGYSYTGRRFRDIPNRHWVVAYFKNQLHLARITGKMRSERSHPLNTDEIFKYRKIREKKSFSLAKLPDVYRLVPSA